MSFVICPRPVEPWRRWRVRACTSKAHTSLPKTHLGFRPVWWAPLQQPELVLQPSW